MCGWRYPLLYMGFSHFEILCSASSFFFFFLIRTIILEQVPSFENEKCQTQKPSVCHHVHTGIKMTGERRTKPAPSLLPQPPSSTLTPTAPHTLYLACRVMNLLQNLFVAQSRRIPLRDNVLKGYRAAPDAPSFREGPRPLTGLPQAGFIDINALGKAMESELHSCCLTGLPVALLENSSKGLSSARLRQCPCHFRGSRIGQINVTVNTRKDRGNQRPAGTDFFW